jgi:hypothetical protein
MQRAKFSAMEKRRRRDSGAMLLAVLFMMALMVIAALAVAPAFIQQAKRDREQEMIHRGTEYARAVKKYYKKFGRYPANVEQLENTNNMRFLRRRYKDPLNNGDWKLLHYGDIVGLIGAQGLNAALLQQQQQGLAGGALGRAPGQGNLNSPFAANANGLNPNTLNANVAAAAGGQLPTDQQAALLATQAAAGQMAVGSAVTGTDSAGGGQSDSSGGQSGGAGGGQNSAQPGQTGSNNSIFGNTGVGGQTFGGGAIVGVASKSKDPTIRIYNKKKKYDEWVFIYNPMFDRVNTLLRGPYNGETMIVGQVAAPPGTSAPGQVQQGAPGVALPPGQQQGPQQLTPPTQFPPDQQQPQ